MNTAQTALTLTGDVLSVVQSELWADAFKHFEASDSQASKALLDFEQQTTLKVVQESLDAATKAQKDLQDDQRKVKILGREFTFYDVFTSVVGFIKAFQSVIDSAVALDVTGKVALPWAGIKFLLSIVTNEHDEFSAVGDGISTITEVMCYFAKFEPLYFQGELRVAQKLRSAVIDVYSNILKFLATAKSYYEDRKLNSKKVIAKSILYSPARYTGIVASIKSGREKVDMWAKLVERETQQDLIGLVRDMELRSRKQDDDGRLDWMCTGASIHYHAEVSYRRSSGSGLWLLTHSEYDDWWDFDGPSLLWLYGRFGTGKTTLMSLVIDGLLQDPQPSKTSPVVFCYCERGQEPEQILRNLLRQVVNLIPGSEADFHNRDVPPRRDECLETIKKLSRHFNTVTIIIDALDNCVALDESTTREFTYISLLSKLVQMMSDSGSRIKMLISSRPNAFIEKEWKEVKQCFVEKEQPSHRVSAHSICTDWQPRDDIVSLIRNTVESWSPAEFLPHEERPEVIAQAKSYVIETVTEKTEVMFIWAIHTLNRLRAGKNVRNVDDMRKDLESRRLSSTITGFYDEAYRAVPEDSSIVIAIKLLFSAKKNLSLRAFHAALESYDDSLSVRTAEKIISACEGLVVEDQASGCVRLLHPSLRQYLQNKQGYEADAHATTAEVCLRELMKLWLPNLPCYQDWDRGRRRSRSSSREPVLKRPSSQLSSRSSSASRPRSRSSDSRRHDREPGEINAQENSSRREGRNNIWLNRFQRETAVGKTFPEMDEPIENFCEYASIYWATHCSMSENRIGTIDSLDYVLRFPDLEYPTNPFPYWIASVRRLFSQRPFGFYDEHVERELEKCIWEPPSAYLISCIYGLTHIVKDYHKRSSAAGSSERASLSGDLQGSLEHKEALSENHWTTAKIEGLSDIHLTCMFGRLETLLSLVELKRTHKAFSEPDENGRTPLECAVESAKDTKLVCALLDSRTKAGKCRLYNGVLIAAMRNRYCPQRLVQELRFRNGAPGNIKNPNQELLIAALEYPYSHVDWVKSCTPPDPVDLEAVFLAAARWNTRSKVGWEIRKEIWDYLLGKYAPNQDILERPIQWAVEAGDISLVSYLFRRKRPKEEAGHLLEQAASHQKQPLKLVSTLLKEGLREGENSLTASSCALQTALQKALQASLANPIANGELVAKLCSAMTTDQVMLGSNEIKNIAGNRERGAELLQTLLDYKWVVFELSSDDVLSVVKATITNGNPNVLELLLTDPFFPRCTFSEDDFDCMVAGSSNERLPDGLQLKFAAIASPQNMFSAAEPQESWDMALEQSIRLLLEHQWVEEGYITQTLVDRAAMIRGKRVIRLLFDRQADRIRVTLEMVCAAVKNSTYGHILLGFFLTRVKTLRYINNQLVMQVAAAHGTLQTIQFLLRQPRESYRHEFCLAAAANPHPDVVEFLFRKINAVDVNTLKVAAANSDRAIGHLLLQCQKKPFQQGPSDLPDMASLAPVVAEKCQRASTLDRVLSLCADISNIEVDRLLLAATRNQHGTAMLRYIFGKYQEKGISTKVKPVMLEAAASNPVVAPEMLRVLFNECEDDRLGRVITEEVLVKAAQNDSEGPEAFRMLLLEDGVAARVSDKVLKIAGKNKDIIRRMCAQARTNSSTEVFGLN